MDGRLIAELHAARPAAERVCRRVLGSTAAAEDCVSEAVTHALCDPTRLDGVGNIAGWLVTVSRRRALDALRDEARRRRSQESSFATSCHVTGDPADDVADRHEAAWLVASASCSMPSTTWSVMTMRSSGASVHDVADSLGLTARSVESHLLRARRYLKQLLVAAGASVVWLRRLASRAPAAVSLAGLSVVLCLQPSTTPVGEAPDVAMRPQPVVTQAVAIRVDVGRPARVASGMRQVRMQGRSSPVRQGAVIADAGGVTVTEKDRGGADDPVGGTLKCVHELQVTVEHIGC